jgi:hypothetical protein
MLVDFIFNKEEYMKQQTVNLVFKKCKDNDFFYPYRNTTVQIQIFGKTLHITSCCQNATTTTKTIKA